VIEMFMKRIEDDPRISTAHISIYVSLWKLWMEKGDQKPLSFFGHEIRGMCKVSGYATYHKRICELHEYRYIIYTPSFDHLKGSKVTFIELE